MMAVSRWDYILLSSFKGVALRYRRSRQIHFRIQQQTKNMKISWKHRLPVYMAAVTVAVTLYACGGGSGNSGPTRSFWMGATPFFATPTLFPDWRFENLDDKDLLSMHADDFWGVPWDQCHASGCTPPAAWVTKWTNFANAARSQGKTLYLALSPLQDRKRLRPQGGYGRQPRQELGNPGPD